MKRLNRKDVDDLAIALLETRYLTPGAGRMVWDDIVEDESPYGTRFDTGSPDDIRREVMAVVNLYREKMGLSPVDPFPDNEGESS